MKEQYTIDPSIAVMLNINPCSLLENNRMYFDAEENLFGTFIMKVWNSEKKNEEIELSTSPITIFQKRMTLDIKPNAIGIPVGNHYHEIWHVETNRIYYKGDLTVVK